MRPSDLNRVSSSLIQMIFSSRVTTERLICLDKFLMHLCWNSLDCALNKVPPSRTKFKDKTESELNSFMANADFQTQAKYKIKVPKESELVTVRGTTEKSNVHV